MIDFTPEEERALDRAARRQGTTAELLVKSAVEPLLASEEQGEIPEDGSLADQLAYYIGAIDSRAYASASDRTGTAYGKLLLKRHREGYP
jgi:hypothetical protein